jgi:hypothetical protein
MKPLKPKKWATWLPLAEWWYNTSYHTALKLSPFQALYGYPPPMLSEFSIPSNADTDATEFISDRQQLLTKLKENLAQALARMKKYADLKRSERTLELGDMVYIKMQPYRIAAFVKRSSSPASSMGPSESLKKLATGLPPAAP